MRACIRVWRDCCASGLEAPPWTSGKTFCLLNLHLLEVEAKMKIFPELQARNSGKKSAWSSGKNVIFAWSSGIYSGKFFCLKFRENDTFCRNFRHFWLAWMLVVWVSCIMKTSTQPKEWFKIWDMKSTCMISHAVHETK